MPTINVKNVKKCAFCKYWYDPTNHAIAPKSPKTNMWSYDAAEKCMCLRKNYEMKADMCCGEYRNKLEEFIF